MKSLVKPPIAIYHSNLKISLIKKQLLYQLGGTLKSELINNKMFYSGRMTFPMVKVCLYDESTKKYKYVYANNIDRFLIILDKIEGPEINLLFLTEKFDLNNLVYIRKKNF